MEQPKREIVNKNNVKENVILEIERYIKPALVENKIFPLIIIGQNFSTDEFCISTLCNPCLDTVSKRIEVLEFALAGEIKEKLKNLKKPKN